MRRAIVLAERLNELTTCTARGQGHIGGRDGLTTDPIHDPPGPFSAAAPRRSHHPMDRSHRIVFAMLLLSWGLFLGVQSGLATDETEHCHVAWLIGHEHQTADAGFFPAPSASALGRLQLYFRLGADGPEVLYFGRAVVLICTGLSVLAFLLLPRRLARRDNQELPFLGWPERSLSFP